MCAFDIRIAWRRDGPDRKEKLFIQSGLRLGLLAFAAAWRRRLWVAAIHGLVERTGARAGTVLESHRDGPVQALLDAHAGLAHSDRTSFRSI